MGFRNIINPPNYLHICMCMCIWEGQSLPDLEQVKNHQSTPTFSFKILLLICSCATTTAPVLNTYQVFMEQPSKLGIFIIIINEAIETK